MNAAGWMKRGSSVGGLQIVSLLSRSLFPSAVPVFEVDWGRMLKKIYIQRNTLARSLVLWSWLRLQCRGAEAELIFSLMRGKICARKCLNIMFWQSVESIKTTLDYGDKRFVLLQTHKTSKHTFLRRVKHIYILKWSHDYAKPSNDIVGLHPRPK